MLTISPTQYLLKKALLQQKVLAIKDCVPAIENISIWQFREGSQGSYQEIATYTGYVATVELPILKATGACTCQVLEQDTFRLILIGDILCQVEESRAAGIHVRPFVILNSNVNVVSKEDIVRGRLCNVEKELAAIRVEIEKLTK